MKQLEKDELLRQLNERQMKLAAIMAESDAHASKCVKLGLSFAETYPEDYAAYVNAREEYNANEIEIARIEAIDVATEEHHDVMEEA